MENREYIKRSDAIRAFAGVPNELYYTCGIVAALEKIPAADVEPVRHGHYIGTEFDGYADGNPVYYEWKCSECDCVFEDDEPKYRYCPNCGAKMDGGGAA